MIRGKRNKSHIDEENTFSCKLRKHNTIVNIPMTLVSSLGNTTDQVVKNKKKDLTYPSGQISVQKVTRNSSLQDQLKKDIEPTCPTEFMFEMKNSKDTQKSGRNSSTKQASSKDRHISCSNERTASKSQTNIVTECPMDVNKPKSKKKRNTHIIIWESKLTGAQRVSKRLSNMRTKNKSTGKVDSFNLFPVVLIKKLPDNINVQKKIRRGKKPTNDNVGCKRRQKSSKKFLCKGQTECFDERKQEIAVDKTPNKLKHHKDETNPKTNLESESVQNKIDGSDETFETEQFHELTRCGDTNLIAEEIKSKNISATTFSEESEISINVEDEVCVSQNDEGEVMQDKINEIDSVDVIEGDTDVIIVELEALETVVDESSNTCVNASETQNHPENKHLDPSTSTDLDVEVKSAVDH